MVINSDYAVLFVQNCLSIAVIMMVNRITHHFKLVEGKNTFLIICMVILFPVQLIMANMIMSEALFQFLLFFLFHFCLRFYFKATYFNAIGIAILISLLLLTKPVSLFVVFIAIAWMVYVLYKKVPLKSIIGYLSIPMMFWVLTLISVGIQQKHQTGYFHYTSMKPFNQFKFNARYVLAQKFGEGYAEHWTDESKTRVNNEIPYKNRYELMQHIGDSVIMTYPLTFAKLYLKGCVAFMLDPGRHDIVAFLDLSEDGYNGFFYELNNKGWEAIPELVSHSSLLLLMSLFILIIWNVIQLFLIIYFLKDRQIPKFVKLLLMAFILYILAVTGILGVARYRSVVFPEIMILLLFVFHSIFNRNKLHTQNN